MWCFIKRPLACEARTFISEYYVISKGYVSIKQGYSDSEVIICFDAKFESDIAVINDLWNNIWDIPGTRSNTIFINPNEQVTLRPNTKKYWSNFKHLLNKCVTSLDISNSQL